MDERMANLVGSSLLGPQAVEGQIRNLFGEGISSFRIVQSESQILDTLSGAVRWSEGNNIYILVVVDGFVEEARLVYDGAIRPSLQNVIVCQGQPTEYFAWYGETTRGSSRRLDVLLFFAEHGTLARAVVDKRFQEKDDGSLLDASDVGDSPVGSLSYTLGTDSQEIFLSTEFSLGPESVSYYHWILSNLQLWPGTWSDISVLGGIFGGE